MRHPLVMGNWKLNGSRHMVHELVSNLRKELAGVAGCAVAIAPPEMYIDMAKREAEGSHIMLGAQNVDLNLSGAFTGETSAAMLKDIGAQYIIIGHSERRTYHKESDELIAKKFAVLKEQGLTPVLCIGETEAENEAGKTEEVCARQIDAVLKTQGAAAFEGAVIAYEPVWAIGTGKSATLYNPHDYSEYYCADWRSLPSRQDASDPARCYSTAPNRRLAAIHSG